MLLLSGALVTPSQALASLGEGELFRFGEAGSGAGQLNLVGFGAGGGITTDPETGHIFIAENRNNRISEFTAWGEFVKAWGWGVRDESSELQTCTTATGCLQGIAGTDAGQLYRPHGIALNAAGDVYVYESRNYRVQVFGPGGEFLRMFGNEVNKTTGADLCTKVDMEGGDECGVGTVGTGPGEFSVEPSTATNGDYIDIAADGTVYVGDHNRIQSFEADGTFKAEIPVPEEGEPGALAVDPVTDDLYYSFGHLLHATANAYRLDTTGAVIDGPLPTTAAEGFAVAADGTAFASEIGPQEGGHFPDATLLELNPLGERVGSCCEEAHSDMPDLAVNTVTAAGGTDLYALRSVSGSEIVPKSEVQVLGPAPDKWPPPSVAPTIVAQYPESVSEDSATLGAEINPNFWGDTRYYLEWGTAPCSEGGCTKVPESPGTLLGAGIVKKTVPAEGIELEGLEPGATYHYRFVAESGGGGPVTGPDATFETFGAPPAPETDCSNQAFRGGSASARLFDCRAYEMVSPVDKLGGDIVTQCTSNCLLPARLNQSTPGGDRVTYSSYRSFGGSESSGYSSQYLGARTAGGWTTVGISPAREGEAELGTNSLDSHYRGFTGDLSTGWLLHDTEPPLAPGAVPGYPDVYRRDLGSGALAAITNEAPLSEVDPVDYYPALQGFSADGRRTFFSAPAKLTEDASSDPGRWQLYEYFEGNLRLASVRTNGGASIDNAWAGVPPRSTGGLSAGRYGNAERAVSEDGTRVYWTDAADAQVSGRIYVRVDAAKTYSVSSVEATFWSATPSGSEAIYAEAGELKRFDLASKSSETLVGAGVVGVMGQSDDLTRIYFVSTEPLAGEAKAGEPNLFLYEDGAPLRFIVTLGEDDLEQSPALSPITSESFRRVARVSSGGEAAIFMSRAPLAGAENTDAVNGEADAEVFRYDAATEELTCVSCSPTGARPHGRETQGSGLHTGYWYASRIPGWEFELHAPRALSSDGSRVFFDTVNRLVPSDVNGMQDVYEWEAAGTGRCTEANPRFSVQVGGCISLISSGQGGDSEFIDASANGNDVFFTTGASLVSWDPDQIDLYDARVGGGFPAPVEAAECAGEACQAQVPAPGLAPNVSQGYFGPGNPKIKPRKHKRHTKHRRHKRGRKSKKHRAGKHAARNKKGKKHKKAARRTGGQKR